MKSTAFAIIFFFICGVVRAGEAEPGPEIPLEQSHGAPYAVDPIYVEGVKESPHIPGSATRLDDAYLRYGDLRDTERLGQYVPNLSVSSGGDRQTNLTSIRGLVNSNFGDPTVSTYSDDIAAADWRGMSMPLFDIEHIDVYRGPQTTRLGKSAQAGMIRVVHRRPSETLQAAAFAAYGSYNTQIYEGAVGGPVLKDKLLFRASGFHQHEDGFQRNRFDGGRRPDYRESSAGRGELLFKPVKELELSLQADGLRADDGNTRLSRFPKHYFDVNINTRRGPETEAFSGALVATWRLPQIELKSITSRQYRSTDHSQADGDQTPEDVVSFRDEYGYVQWAEEFRLSSADKHGKWSWTGGLYFEDRSVEIDVSLEIRNTALIQAPAPAGLGLPFTAPIRDRRTADMHDETRALFGQATYSATECLDVTFGLRFEDRRDSILRNAVLQAPNESANVPEAPVLEEERSSSVFLPRLELGYKVLKDVSLYGIAARGYRPGGFSHLTLESSTAEWHDEFLWNYETGLKTNLWKNRIDLSLSAYYSPVFDYQVRRAITPISIHADNAHRATLQGFETEMFVAPIKHLKFRAALGLSDARFNEFRDNSTGSNFDGNRIALSKSYNFAISADYRHPCGIFAHAELNGFSRYPFNEDNAFHQRVEQLVNLAFGYSRKNFEIYAWGNNLANRHYFLNETPDFAGGLAGIPGAPRIIGLAASYHY